MMNRYLTMWKDGNTVRSAIFDTVGLYRLLAVAYDKKRKLQVAAYKLAESSVHTPPAPVRVFYDGKRDKLTLFTMSGGYIEKVEAGKWTPCRKKEVA